MSINTKQEAYDFLNQNDPHMLIASDTTAATLVFYGATETVDQDEDIIKDLTAAINLAVTSFMNQDCAL